MTVTTPTPSETDGPQLVLAPAALRMTAAALSALRQHQEAQARIDEERQAQQHMEAAWPSLVALVREILHVELPPDTPPGWTVTIAGLTFRVEHGCSRPYLILQRACTLCQTLIYEHLTIASLADLGGYLAAADPICGTCQERAVMKRRDAIDAARRRLDPLRPFVGTAVTGQAAAEQACALLDQYLAGLGLDARQIASQQPTIAVGVGADGHPWVVYGLLVQFYALPAEDAAGYVTRNSG